MTLIYFVLTLGVNPGFPEHREKAFTTEVKASEIEMSLKRQIYSM